MILWRRHSGLARRRAGDYNVVLRNGQWYHATERTRLCHWCGEWVPEYAAHKPHWFEIRRRWWWWFAEKSTNIELSDEPSSHGRCPRCLRKLKHALVRDVMVCPGYGCNYARAGIDEYRRRNEHRT